MPPGNVGVCGETSSLPTSVSISALLLSPGDRPCYLVAPVPGLPTNYLRRDPRVPPPRLPELPPVPALCRDTSPPRAGEVPPGAPRLTWAREPLTPQAQDALAAPGEGLSSHQVPSNEIAKSPQRVCDSGTENPTPQSRGGREHGITLQAPHRDRAPSLVCPPHRTLPRNTEPLRTTPAQQARPKLLTAHNPGRTRDNR